MAQGAPLHPTGFSPARPANSYGSNPILGSSYTTVQPPTVAVSEGTIKTHVKLIIKLYQLERNLTSHPPVMMRAFLPDPGKKGSDGLFLPARVVV